MELSKRYFSGRWGLEREVLRIDEEGRLAATPHPFPPEESQITVDFAEAQTELITGVHPSPLAALEELEVLQTRLEASLGNELLWPFSVPGVWSGASPARFADEPAWEEQRRYRRALEASHGSARQVISGIHLNYSFGPDHPGGDLFALARNYLRLQPILTYLLGASPWMDRGFQSALGDHRPSEAIRSAAFCAPHTASVRQGGLGYGLPAHLEEALDVRFDSLEEYLEKLRRALRPRDGLPPLLGHEREFYAPVRPKSPVREKGRTLEALAQNGVSYLEFRNFDLDPLAPLGIRAETLLFLELFLIAATVLPSPRMTPEDRHARWRLERSLAQCSLGGAVGAPGRVRALWDEVAPTMEAMARWGTAEHREALARFQSQIEGRSARTVDQVTSHWEGNSPRAWGLERARLHRAWPTLELSTRLLIEEADRRGVGVELIDAEENFLLLKRDGKREYVKQATRTSADPSITALIMESKTVTKRLLRREGLKVPDGREFSRPEEAWAEWEAFRGRSVVVKPNATNFGDGVSILDAAATEEQWKAAVNGAFSCDRRVLVEEFAPGLEFRFLVIGGRTRAVLHRVPANVVGDGGSSIRALVEAKNAHPWRGEGYRKPLEKLRLDAVELEHLASQGRGPDSVPAAGERVFLRTNSNISTGGDSIDFTDAMPPVYHRIAERAAAAVGAKICGLDLILPDWTDGSPDADYTILELNFNPALHIHAYPAEGTSHRAEGAVLDLLGFSGGGEAARI